MTRFAAALILACAFMVRPAHAQIPVTDVAALVKWAQQAQQMAAQLTQLEYTVHALTNIPQNLARQVEGLISAGVRNPLQDLQMGLSGLTTGGPIGGTCAQGAGQLATMTRYGVASGGDFAGARINASSYQSAGVLSCLQTLTRSTQERMDQMPGLIEQVQGCDTDTCANAISGRIQTEMGLIQTQHIQGQMIATQAQMQRWIAEDQMTQKIRLDAQATTEAAGGRTTGLGGAPVADQGVPAFNVAGGQ